MSNRKIVSGRLTLWGICCCVLCLSAGAWADDSEVGALAEQLRSGTADEQAEAVQRVAELGPRAAAALPELIALLESNDLALRYEALLAIERMGPYAAPAVGDLRAALGDKSTLVQHGALGALRRIGPPAAPALAEVKPLLQSDNILVRTSAARTLIALAEGDARTADAATRVLLDSLASDRGDVQSEAIQGLATLGAACVKPVTGTLDQPRPELASRACEVLALVGPPATDAVPRLIKLLASPDANVRARAARALGTINSDSADVVPALAQALADASPAVRVASADAIGRYGANGERGVTALTTALADPDDVVRSAAASALGEIGPNASSAVPALSKSLDDSVGSVTVTAANALGGIGPDAVPVLTARLADPNYRLLVLSVLGEMGPAAKSALPGLIPLIRDPDQMTRMEALIAIAAIGPDARSATGELVSLLESNEPFGRAGAAYALGKIGAKDAIPALKKGVDDPSDVRVQMASAWALASLDVKNDDYVKPAIPKLIAGLSSEIPLARREVARLLGQIGPRAKNAVPALIAALDDEPEIAGEALHALAQMGPDAAPAIPAAIGLLDDSELMVRVTACYLLGRMGKLSREAAAPLAENLRSVDEVERIVAAWALVQIAPTPEIIQTAVPLMLKAIERENPEARMEGARLLGEIGRGRPEVKERLQKLLKDPDERVRQAADTSLSRLAKP